MQRTRCPWTGNTETQLKGTYQSTSTRRSGCPGIHLSLRRVKGGCYQQQRYRPGNVITMDTLYILFPRYSDIVSDTSSEPFCLSFLLTHAIFSIQTQTRDTFYPAPLIRSVIQNQEERSKLIISLCACLSFSPRSFCHVLFGA